MKIIRDFYRKCNIKNPVIALGNFDGLHLGHQTLVKKAVDIAHSIDGTSVLFTFYPHPHKIIKQTSKPFIIQTFKEKVKIAELLGIDVVVCARFTKEFADMHPNIFVEDVLVHNLGAKYVCVGHDYTFGAKGNGSIKTLRQLSNRYGFELVVIPPIKLNGEIVSSTRIRDFLRNGEVDRAREFLGRPYSISGVVKKGDGRGTSLGFPTANIYPKNEIMLKNGVYAAYVYVGDKKYQSAVNVGYNPTFKGKDKHIEAFLLKFDKSIYGEKIKIEFIEFIRDERKFRRVEDLISQIREDISKVEHIL
jgi:riboflavin kinase/FMN adenylyltransferase